MNLRLGLGPLSLRLTPWTIGLGFAIASVLGAGLGGWFSLVTWLPY